MILNVYEYSTKYRRSTVHYTGITSLRLVSTYWCLSFMYRGSRVGRQVSKPVGGAGEGEPATSSGRTLREPLLPAERGPWVHNRGPFRKARPVHRTETQCDCCPLFWVPQGVLVITRSWYSSGRLSAKHVELNTYGNLKLWNDIKTRNCRWLQRWMESIGFQYAAEGFAGVKLSNGRWPLTRISHRSTSRLMSIPCISPILI